MRTSNPVDKEEFLRLWHEQKLSISLIQIKLKITRYKINSLVKELDLKPREELMVKKRNPDQEWTDEKIKDFMSIYRSKGSREAAIKHGVSKEYSCVLKMRFENRGF